MSGPVAVPKNKPDASQPDIGGYLSEMLNSKLLPAKNGSTKIASAATQGGGQVAAQPVPTPTNRDGSVFLMA
jgi:hypothetical protein